MTQLASIPIFSTKRLLLCSRENAARVAAQIFDQNRRACVVRTDVTPVFSSRWN
jgi:hypothetical protein